MLVVGVFERFMKILTLLIIIKKQCNLNWYFYINNNFYRAKDPSLWWDKGCAQALNVWFFERLHIAGGVVLGIAFLQVISLQSEPDPSNNQTLTPPPTPIQLFGLIASMVLFCTIKHMKKSDSYKSYSPQVDGTLQRNSNRTSSYMDD